MAKQAEVPSELQKKLHKKFEKMMSALFREKGTALRIDILREPEVESFIETHSDILDSTFAQEEMSDEMRANLQRSDYIFSGFKTFHEVGEAFYSLLDEDGKKKPFNQFLNDVKKIDQTYNERYLRAEYNFVSASADMAARWEQFSKDEDEYYLQYRTANDGAVRPEHAALHDVTLPASDSFWDSYYPPNGWNCRCTVVQVLRYMHEPTPHNEAMQRGAKALANDKKGMFNFNPGKQQKTFPDYNPYTISKCKGCTKANLKLFAGDPDNPLCQECGLIRICADENAFYADIELGKRLLISSRADLKDLEQNIQTARKLLTAFPNSSMEIRRHYKDGRKNPEYTIDGIVADRKGIEGYKGITTGFRSSLGQGCKAVIFDLDQHMGEKPLPTRKLARKLYGRKDDFITGRMERCYIVHRGKAILITKDDYAHGGKDDSLEWLEGLLG